LQEKDDDADKEELEMIRILKRETGRNVYYIKCLEKSGFRTTNSTG
jgi:hypothetical protein